MSTAQPPTSKERLARVEWQDNRDDTFALERRAAKRKPNRLPTIQFQVC